MRTLITALVGSVLGCFLGSSVVWAFAQPACRPDPAVHFATFGNAARFSQSLARIAGEATAMDTFATIFAISDAGLGQAFWQKYGSFVERHPRGFGYWIWKPWICWHILNALPEGDVLVYADSGCTLNPLGCRRLREYIASARSHPDGIVAFRLNDHPEHDWTKQATLDAFGCTKAACTEAPQILATAFVIRNSPVTRRLVQRWLELATANDGALVVDSTDDEAPYFKEHRHDQSLWSLLVKSHPGTVVYDNEVDARLPFAPVWGTRRRE